MIVLALSREQRLSRSTGSYAVIDDDPTDPTVVTSVTSEERATVIARNLNDRADLSGHRYVVAYRVGNDWVWGAGATYQRGSRAVFGAGAPTGQSRFVFQQGHVRVA